MGIALKTNRNFYISILFTKNVSIFIYLCIYIDIKILNVDLYTHKFFMYCTLKPEYTHYTTSRSYLIIPNQWSVYVDLLIHLQLILRNHLPANALHSIVKIDCAESNVVKM